jgi:hypothetical protein
MHSRTALSRQNAQARRSFAELLDAHLRRGQHSETPQRNWKPWTNVNFAGVAGVSPNSVANWRSHTSPIPPDDLLPILDALFGERAEFSGYRRDLKEAWERAKGLIPIEDLEPNNEWEPAERVAFTAIAEAIIHPPTHTNRGPENYLINATVRFADAEYFDRDASAVVGLEKAYLTIEAPGYQIAQNSLLGERTPHTDVEPTVGGLSIVGPLIDGHLKGNPIGDDYVAGLEPAPHGGDTIAIILAASPRSFRFGYIRDSDTPSIEDKPNRAAILSLIFGEAMTRDAMGRVILAKASLHRKMLE